MIFLEIIFLELVFAKALVFILTNWKCQSKSKNKNIFFKVKKNLLFVHAKENIHRSKARSQMWNVHF